MKANLKMIWGAVVLLAWMSSRVVAGEAGGDGARLEAARERARLLHDVYATTLEVMHRYYFQKEKAVLPARASITPPYHNTTGSSGLFL